MEKEEKEESHFETFLKKLDIANANALQQQQEQAQQKVKPICLYYISLENNKMFLYADYLKPDEEIMQDCQLLYAYAKINRPQKIVFTTQNIDLYEIDSIVKHFMNAFGIDTVRGGSYTDNDLPEDVIYHIQKECNTVMGDQIIENNQKLVEIKKLYASIEQIDSLVLNLEENIKEIRRIDDDNINDCNDYNDSKIIWREM